MTSTRDITWLQPFSMSQSLPDGQATDSWQNDGNGDWSLLVNRMEPNGALMTLVTLSATVESPMRIIWNNNIQQQAFGNCQVIVNGELVKLAD